MEEEEENELLFLTVPHLKKYIFVKSFYSKYALLRLKDTKEDATVFVFNKQSGNLSHIYNNKEEYWLSEISIDAHNWIHCNDRHFVVGGDMVFSFSNVPAHGDAIIQAEFIEPKSSLKPLLK
jgi:hypothetical protein